MQYLVCAHSKSDVQALQGDSMLMRNAISPLCYTSLASLHVSSHSYTPVTTCGSLSDVPHATCARAERSSMAQHCNCSRPWSWEAP